MMAGQKHLSELLKEDQEPFLLKQYISDWRSQLKGHSSTLQLKKQPQPLIHQNSNNFPLNLCKNACFFSIPDTPDLPKSPLFRFTSPAKSPAASPIFLHIPARTAALLLEAALRIQKQSSSSKHNAFGFGLFGSFFRRLKQRSRNRKREIQDEQGVTAACVKDILRWDSSVSNALCEKAEFVGCCNDRPSCSAVWSENNEDKFLGMETSCTSHWDESEDIVDSVLPKHNPNTKCNCCHDAICQSPFRFVLLRSPSSACRTPELPSPASSPTRPATEDKENNGVESVNEFQSGEEAEEEKEQCSPVSVLDPPFEDDDDGHENNEEEHEEEEEEDGFDLDSSYAIVQRAKEQLLNKLRRFEKLAGLDPLELEKRIIDDEEEDYDEDDDKTYIEEECEDDNKETWDKEKECREITGEDECQSSLGEKGEMPADHKRLIHDLIMEEREVRSVEDEEEVIRGVCERLELWKEVETNTIDMMIEEDFGREDCGWKKNEEQIKQVAAQLEFAIFGFLVEEISEDLVG